MYMRIPTVLQRKTTNEGVCVFGIRRRLLSYEVFLKSKRDGLLVGQPFFAVECVLALKCPLMQQLRALGYRRGSNSDTVGNWGNRSCVSDGRSAELTAAAACAVACAWIVCVLVGLGWRYLRGAKTLRDNKTGAPPAATLCVPCTSIARAGLVGKKPAAAAWKGHAPSTNTSA